MDIANILLNIATQLLIALLYGLRKYNKTKRCGDGSSETPERVEPEDAEVGTQNAKSNRVIIPRRSDPSGTNEATTHGSLQPRAELQNQ